MHRLAPRLAALCIATTLARPTFAQPEAAEPAPKPERPAETTPSPPAPPPPRAAPAQAPLVTYNLYGFVLLQSFWNDGPFANKDYPGQVLTNGDGGSFLLSARGTRIGIRLGLPNDPLTGAQLSGVIEFDFKGGNVPTVFTTTCPQPPASGNTTCTTTAVAASTNWYNALPRLRLAFARATWSIGGGRLDVVAGQDARIVSPLAPTSIAYGYDQLFKEAGNLYQRDPQLKVVFDRPVGSFAVRAAAAMASPQDPFTQVPTGNNDYGAGNRSRLPNLEARVAGAYVVQARTLFELGVAGVLSPRRYNAPGSLNGVDATGRIVAVDGQLHLPWFTLQGEAFASDGAEDSYLGAVTSAPGAVVLATQGGTTTVTKLQSRGGWVQLVLKPASFVQLPVGYGVEQLRYKDVGLPATTRTRNSQLTAGVILNPTNPWKVAFEWTHTTSGYALATTGPQTVSADQFALSTRLDF